MEEIVNINDEFNAEELVDRTNIINFESSNENITNAFNVINKRRNKINKHNSETPEDTIKRLRIQRSMLMGMLSDLHYYHSEIYKDFRNTDEYISDDDDDDEIEETMNAYDFLFENQEIKVCNKCGDIYQCLKQKCDCK